MLTGRLLSYRAAEEQVNEALELAEQSSARARLAEARSAALEVRAAAAEQAAIDAAGSVDGDGAELRNLKLEMEALQSQQHAAQESPAELL